MFWLYLLGTVTILSIALRRVVTRENALKDNAFSKTVAFEHAQSGIAWVQKDGVVETMNASLACSLGINQNEVSGTNWCKLFAEKDQYHLQNAYSQMLLSGQARLNVSARDAAYPVSQGVLELLLVAVHDRKMRFAGHYCLVADRSRERKLAAEVAQLRKGHEGNSGKARVERRDPIMEDDSEYDVEYDRDQARVTVR